MKKLVVVILVAVVGLAVAGCNDVESINGEDYSEQQSKGELTFNSNEVITMENLDFSVTNIRYSQGGEWIKPDEGMEYVIIEGRFENVGEESENISSMLMFTLVDQDGRSQDINLGAETNGNLDGQLGVGRVMTGEIAYQVPKDAQSLELIYTPDPIKRGQAFITIK